MCFSHQRKAIAQYFAGSVNSDLVTILRVFRVFRALAVLRLYRLANSYQGYDHEVCFLFCYRVCVITLTKSVFDQLAVLIFTTVALIFVAAGTFQALEQDKYEQLGLHLQFHNAVYFVFVTISTVGMCVYHFTMRRCFTLLCVRRLW